MTLMKPPGLMIVLCLLLMAGSTLASDRTIAITHVTVLPMDTDRLLPDHTVLVQGDRIVALAPSSDLSIPEQALIIEGRNRFLLPGLTDMHVHLKSKEDLFLYIAHGITSVFNLNGRPEDLEWREAIRQGRLEGPNIFSTGPSLGGDPPLNPRFKRIRDAAEAVAAVQAIAARGYDGIKVYSGLKAEVYPAVVSEAQKQKLPIMGHIPWEMRFEGVLEAGGMAAIAHAEELFAGYISPTSRYISGDHNFVPGPGDEARLSWAAKAMKERDMYLIANAWFMDRVWQQARDHRRVLSLPEFDLLSPEAYTALVFSRYAQRENHQRYEKRVGHEVRFLRKMLPALQREGVHLLMGSDAPVPGVLPGLSGLQEIRYKVEHGLTPYQALRTATGNVARFFEMHLGGLASIGLVREGFRADLLLLAGNPLEDIDHLEQRAGVMVRGVWYDQADLEERLNRKRAANRPFRASFNRFNEMLQAGRADEAAAFLQQKDNPLIPHRQSVAWACYRAAKGFLGDPATAEQAAKMAALADRYVPDYPAILELLGQAHRKAGADELAIHAYQRLLKINPEHQEARTILGELKGNP